MAIADDFSVALNGDIRYVGAGSTYYTVLEIHRYLHDLADNAESTGNDLLDITSTDPSDRSTDNIITLISPYNIDDATAEQLYDGSITQAGGDVRYSGLVVVGNVVAGTELMISQNNTIISPSWWGTGINTDPDNNILMRTLIKTRTAGADIDGRRIRVLAREFGDTYAEFDVTLGLGNSTAAVFTADDLNNQTAAATVETWTTITNTEGYQLLDLENGNGNRPYYSQWTKATYTINQLYERTKWLQRRGTTSTVYGMNGELFRGINAEWNYDNELTGPFSENEVLSWGTGATAGTGTLLALKDDGTTGTMWIQHLTGALPSDNTAITGGVSGATCDVDGTVTARTISPAFLGASTGTAIIGAFGVGVKPADLSVSDTLFDLTNTIQQPPNFQSFVVGGIVSGEDRVIVTQNDGLNEIDYDQFTLFTTLSGATETSVVITVAIPSDTPSSGAIRVKLDSGVFKFQEYTSYSGSTFTIPSTDYSGANQATAGNNVFISYIDELASATSASYTAVYSADRTLVVKVRDGGVTPIKPFKTPATYGSAGGAVTAIRTSDV